MADKTVLEGSIVDVVNSRVFPGRITFEAGIIVSVEELAGAPSTPFIMPGFIDSHVHIESSMLTPSAFARIAVKHGTVGTVSDPHEIANVLGMEGIGFMLEDASKVPFHFNFGAPPCVPATTFETSGASISAQEIEELLNNPRIGYLAEVMNFPGVLAEDPDLMQKIRAAQRVGKPVDGHAPGLRGTDARRYASFGITTDHECFTLDEAIDKVEAGMKILIREGSAAKNFNALSTLFFTHPEKVMLCSDDKHPDALLEGHINELLSRAVALGVPPLAAIRAATVNPVRHYQMDVGLLQEGDPADVVVVEDLEKFRVLSTYIRGEEVFGEGELKISKVEPKVVNKFECKAINAASLTVNASGPVRVIKVLEGQLITEEEVHSADDYRNRKNDVAKVVVVNRYHDAPPAVAFVKGFTLSKGAIASSVAHDSHNIVAVGINDADIAAAVNEVIRSKGGLSLAYGQHIESLPLPIGGLMSDKGAEEVAARYTSLDTQAKELGSTLPSPFMTLSFLALLVIPKLKLSDKGLFDGEAFRFVPLEVPVANNA